MNTKTCKDCPCCTAYDKDQYECHIDPPIPIWRGDNYVFMLPCVEPYEDWCYRGREVMRIEATREQAPF